MLSQKTKSIRILKQENDVSLIALFHCLITIENICFLSRLYKESRIRMLKFFNIYVQML